MNETAVCRMCKNPLQRASPDEPWRHIGIQPRHPGVPERPSPRLEPIRHTLCRTVLTIRGQHDGTAAPWCDSCEQFVPIHEMSSKGPFSVALKVSREVE